MIVLTNLSRPRAWKVLLVGAALMAWWCLMTPPALAAPSGLPSIPHTICKGAPIPPGWIIMDTFNNAHICSGGTFNFGNVWAIAPAPRTATAVCATSPVPGGFVIVSQTTDPRHLVNYTQQLASEMFTR